MVVATTAVGQETKPAPATVASTTWPQADMNALAPIAEFPKEAAVFANRPGFCLDLGCGDGSLAAEIAKKTQYTVFALAKDDADCEQARQTLDKSNLYGARAAAVSGSLQTLPFPNGYGNLIVTGDYQESLNLRRQDRQAAQGVPRGLLRRTQRRQRGDHAALRRRHDVLLQRRARRLQGR